MNLPNHFSFTPSRKVTSRINLDREVRPSYPEPLNTNFSKHNHFGTVPDRISAGNREQGSMSHESGSAISYPCASTPVNTSEAVDILELSNITEAAQDPPEYIIK